MQLGTGITNLRWFQRPVWQTSRCLCIKLEFFTSYSSAQVSQCVDDDNDFLSWLEQKAGVVISSVLSIRKSTHGRSLFASKPIRTGDCLLNVPFSVQISADNAFPEINPLLVDEVGNVAKLAMIILFEQKLGQDSEWSPYICRLPQPGEMHNTIFWSEGEMQMVRQSLVYQETMNLKAQIENDFMAIRRVLHHFPKLLKDTTFSDFMHAYTLVGSRAWWSKKGLSMIPFADFFNHNGVSEADVLCDDDKKCSEVIADRNYAPGEQVLIRYGKFSNATLLLDFGFTLPYNIYDQVQIQLNIPHHDLLRTTKLELLHKHCTPTIKDVNSFNSSWDSFTIKEVRSSNGKGRGIPQSLRAFARVLCCTSPKELSDLATEAAQNDGRLARRPLNRSREIEAGPAMGICGGCTRIRPPLFSYFCRPPFLKKKNSKTVHLHSAVIGKKN